MERERRGMLCEILTKSFTSKSGWEKCGIALFSSLLYPLMTVPLVVVEHSLRDKGNMEEKKKYGDRRRREMRDWNRFFF